MGDIRVVIVEGASWVRLVLSPVLREAPGITIVGEAINSTGVIRQIHEHHPEVLILDADMPQVYWVNILNVVTKFEDDVLILAVGKYLNRRKIKKICELGAVGYLAKVEAEDEIVDAIQRASQGETNVFSTSVEQYLAS